MIQLTLFIGIDPGFGKGKLGLAALRDEQSSVQAYGVDILKDIAGTLADTLRAEQIKDFVYRWINDFTNKPLIVDGICINAPVIVIEAPAFGRQPARSVQTGVLHSALYRAILSLKYAHTIVVPPTVLKKYVTGKGNASKELMMESIIRKWFSGNVPFFGTQDLYEAYALAEFGRFLVTKTKDKKLKASVDAYEINKGKVMRGLL